MDNDATALQQDHDMEPDAVASSPKTVNQQSLTRANPVLQNPYLLQSIFEQFYDQNEGRVDGSRRFLLYASLTCRAFFEPAMDVMWRELNSIMPILRIIPSLERDGGDNYHLEGLVLNQHLERVNFYSRRIRAVKLIDQAEIVEPTAGIVLSRIQQVKPSFPLNRLSITFGSVPYFQISVLMSLAPCSLTTMCLRGIQKDSAILAASLMQAMAGNGKTLEVLELVGQLSTTLIGTLSSCTRIQSLHLEFNKSSATPEFLWTILLSMAALRRLYLGAQIADLSPGTLSLDAIQTHSLDKLEHVEFSGPPAIVGVWIEHICVLHVPMLSTFSFACSLGTPTNGAQPDFATCVQRSTRLACKGEGIPLRELRIGAKNKDTPIPFALTFGCLATCDQIQILHISTTKLHINSQDIRTFIQCGPLMKNLQELYLVNDHEPTHGQRLSLYILRILAQKCTRLTILQVSLDAKCSAGDLEAMQREINCERGSNVLHTLVIPRLSKSWDYTISSAVAFSSLLDHLFPKLRFLEFGPTQPEKHERWWKGVNEMLSVYRRISRRGVTVV